MKPETSASLKVIAFGFFLIFLIFLGISAPFFLRQRDVLKNWVVTDARVRDSDVVSFPGKRGATYDAHIVVVYRLGDAIRTVMVNSGYRSSHRSHAQEWVDHYPAGSSVMIAYNPLDPNQVRLDPGYNRFFFAVPLFVVEVGLGFAIAAFIFYAIARRADRRNRSTNGAH
jgi:Protein of unknown function (DUF3592)